MSEIPKFEMDLSVQRMALIPKFFRFESILDVGCRYGYALKYMAQQASHARLVGVDCEQDICDFAEENSEGQYEVYCADGTKLPFEDGEFDIVYCAHTLEHCKDIPGVIDELHRVCRVGLFIVVPLEGEDKYHKLRAKEEELNNPESCWHQFFTKDPFVWMDFFRDRDLLPVHYSFTNHSDMVLVLNNERTNRTIYGAFNDEIRGNSESLPSD